MRVLLLSGLGPYIKNEDYLEGTFLAPNASNAIGERYLGIVGQPITTNSLQYQSQKGDKRYPVLRPRRQGFVPHLTSYTLRFILENAGVDYEYFDLDFVWSGSLEPKNNDFDVVALSTTFICDFCTLRRVIAWVTARFPKATLVLGGQYSNLKFAKILAEIPAVHYIIRGDGEVALPRLLTAVAGWENLQDVPNLVARKPGTRSLVHKDVQYIDLNEHPSPAFSGHYPVIPYETMRGCPFTCKFCSFPAASPMWRHKSAEKICRDWQRYAEFNGSSLIRALDSTFTVPLTRFRSLLQMLPQVGVHWEAYTRANVLRSPEIMESLERAYCKILSIGFESMSDASLKYMDKKVTSIENMRAFQLLSRSTIDFRVSFMVGYPGETPEDYEETHRFIVDKFVGRFMLSVFSLVDETMPVWDDMTRWGIEVQDPENPDYAWRHRGMDVITAKQLYHKTLNEARWRNDKGILLLWQMKYELPLIPDLPSKQNHRIEKLIERLAFLPRDFPDNEQASQRFAEIVTELKDFDIDLVASSA